MYPCFSSVHSPGIKLWLLWQKPSLLVPACSRRAAWSLLPPILPPWGLQWAGHAGPWLSWRVSVHSPTDKIVSRNNKWIIPSVHFKEDISFEIVLHVITNQLWFYLLKAFKHITVNIGRTHSRQRSVGGFEDLVTSQFLALHLLWVYFLRHFLKICLILISAKTGQASDYSLRVALHSEPADSSRGHGGSRPCPCH